MRKLYVTLGLALLLFVSARTSFAQDARPAAQTYDQSGSWVFADFFEVPWSKVDSLLKLTKILPDIRAAARELDCQQNIRLLIHNVGTEQNVVWLHYFETLDDLRAGGFPSVFQCLDRAVTEVIPDSVHRAAWWEGYSWVFGPDFEHSDIIYWEAYPDKE